MIIKTTERHKVNIGKICKQGMYKNFRKNKIRRFPQSIIHFRKMWSTPILDKKAQEKNRLAFLKLSKLQCGLPDTNRATFNSWKFSRFPLLMECSEGSPTLQLRKKDGYMFIKRVRKVLTLQLGDWVIKVDYWLKWWRQRKSYKIAVKRCIETYLWWRNKNICNCFSIRKLYSRMGLAQLGGWLSDLP